MQCELHLSVRSFAKLSALKLELIQSHIGKHLFILVLASHSELARFDEWSGLFDASDLLRIQCGHDFTALHVFASWTLVLVTELPVLIETVVRAVDYLSYFFVSCWL